MRGSGGIVFGFWVDVLVGWRWIRCYLSMLFLDINILSSIVGGFLVGMLRFIAILKF